MAINAATVLAIHSLQGEEHFTSLHEFFKQAKLFQEKECPKPVSTMSIGAVGTGTGTGTGTVNGNQETLTIWVTSAALFTVPLLALLLPHTFPNQDFAVVAMPRDDYLKTAHAPFLLVTSTLDGSLGSGFCDYSQIHINTSNGSNTAAVPHWPLVCMQHVERLFEQSKASRLLLINGEAVDLSAFLQKEDTQKSPTMPRKLLSLSALSEARYHITPSTSLQGSTKSIHMSPAVFDVAMDWFANGQLNISVLQSLSSLYTARNKSWATETRVRKTGAVAYLYYRCDRPHRERMFRLLQAKDCEATATTILTANASQCLHTVRAIGRCHGTGEPLSNPLVSDRLKPNQPTSRYYEDYRFMVAFENAAVPGYLTEKLVHAYLAHTVPIYWGAPDAVQYFHEDSFINCNHFESLDRCVEEVVAVENDPVRYEKMLQTAPFKSKIAWCRFFNPVSFSITNCSNSVDEGGNIVQRFADLLLSV
jgi:hypothetical protein